MTQTHSINRSVVAVVAVTAVVFVVAAATVLGGFVQRAQLQSKETALSDSVARRQALIASLQERLAAQRAGLGEYEASVRSYMLDHKAVVASLVAMGAGGSVVLDQSNSFSKDAKNVAAVVGGAGLLYCVANVSECSTVLGELDKADARRRTLESEIASTGTAIEREASLLLNELASLEAVRRELGE